MGYYESIAACKTERELLELWKTKEPVTRSYVDKKKEKAVSINHKNVFISDGIVDEVVWNNQIGKKILYVLKEAYGENEDWNLTEWLLRTKPSTSIWKRVIEWTYGIQNTTESNIANIHMTFTNIIQNCSTISQW